MGCLGKVKNVGFDHILIVFVIKVGVGRFVRCNIDYNITNWRDVEIAWLSKRALR